MGWCHEFGPQIAETCDHPMVAGATSCSCTICGTVCTGRFAGCNAVWARGPKQVAVNAPHFAATTEGGKLDLTESDNGERWRLPLEPMKHSMVTGKAPEREGAPIAAPVSTAATVATGTNGHARVDEPLEFEAPDVTARFAVAQLGELNERLAALTELATEKTDATLEKVHHELRRITSMREVDLTEQASGIFTAVQAGSEALEQFAKVVGEVTADLRTVLADALASIGGTEGLAAWVAHSAAEVTDVRQEVRNAFARIERDMSVLRNQAPLESMKVTLGDDQVTFIVEAVTESVLSALTAQELRSASRRR